MDRYWEYRQATLACRPCQPGRLRIEKAQCRRGSTGLTHGAGLRDPGAKRRGGADEVFVEDYDRVPLGGAASRARR